MNKSHIKRILVISLTNIGDIVLTFPVIDILKKDFPDAELSVCVGPKGEEMLKNNSIYKNVYIFDKQKMGPGVIKWLYKLRQQRFDLVVDLRNSAIPFLISARYKASPFMKRDSAQHMRFQHLNRLKSIYAYKENCDEHFALEISNNDKTKIDDIIKSDVGDDTQFVVVGPGAADEKKRWTKEGFAAVCDYLINQYQVKIVFIGDKRDVKIVENVQKLMKGQSVNLSGKLSLLQLAYLLKKSLFAFVNDSAPLHLASYFDVPVIAVFGPTNPQLYGPWSRRGYALKHDDYCPACHNNGKGDHTCMITVQSQKVISAINITSEGVSFSLEGGSLETI